MSVRLCLWLGALALMASVSVRAAGRDPVDAIVVLGHRPPRDEHGVEAETRLRVSRGVELLRAGRAPRLVVTGGATTPGVIEADVMAELAVSLGASPEHVLRERRARDTIENARFSLAILRALLGAQQPRVLLVTSDYHMARAARLFRCAGAEVETSAVALDAPFHTRVARQMRELSVRTYYWFVDECARARGD